MTEQTTTSTEIVNIEDAAAPGIGQEIVGITGDAGNAFYSSLRGADFETKLQVAEAQSNAEPLSDHLGETINIKNIIIQEVTLNKVDENTGEVTGTTQAPRATIIDDAGNSYSATSVGIFSSLRQLIQTVGEPETWEKAIPVHFVQAGVAPRKYMTMRFGAAKAKK